MRLWALECASEKSTAAGRRLELGKDYQLRMTAHNAAGSTENTYTLTPGGAPGGAAPSLVAGPGSGLGSGLDPAERWLLGAATTAVFLAVAAFLAGRRRHKRSAMRGQKTQNINFSTFTCIKTSVANFANMKDFLSVYPIKSKHIFFRKAYTRKLAFSKEVVVLKETYIFLQRFVERSKRRK